jgi:hypothetical protein
MVVLVELIVEGRLMLRVVGELLLDPEVLFRLDSKEPVLGQQRAVLRENLLLLKFNLVLRDDEHYLGPLFIRVAVQLNSGHLQLWLLPFTLFVVVRIFGRNFVFCEVACKVVQRVLLPDLLLVRLGAGVYLKFAGL